MTGCRGFLLPSERDNIRKSAMWAKVWGPRVDAESFCNGAQSAAAYCRVVATSKPRQCQRKPIDLLQDKALWAAVAPRTEALVQATRAIARKADWTPG